MPPLAQEADHVDQLHAVQPPEFFIGQDLLLEIVKNMFRLNNGNIWEVTLFVILLKYYTTFGMGLSIKIM